MIRIAISGCRPPKSLKVADIKLMMQIERLVRQTVMDFSSDVLIVHGGAIGVDTIAEKTAQERGLPTEIWLPDYDKYGKEAPKVRNKYVETVEILHAFPGPWSKGTWDAINKARTAGVCVINHAVEYWPDGE